jgi:hypothetical protein
LPFTHPLNFTPCFAAFDANIIYDSVIISGSTSHPVSRNLYNQYYWRVRYQDSKEEWSPWSDETSFSVTGLISSWHLDEGAGTTAADTGCGNNNGTITGTSYWSTGFSGNGLSCSGDDKVSWGYTGGRPFNTFSLEAMVQVTTTHDQEGESLASTVGVGGQKYVFGANYYLAPDAGMGVSIGTNGIAVYEHSGYYMPPLANYNGNLATSTWHHLASPIRTRPLGYT